MCCHGIALAEPLSAVQELSLTRPLGAWRQVMIPRADQYTTLCVSSQVGCRRACSFCATGTMGLQRSLTNEEILEQVHLALRVGREQAMPPLRNVVFMGMGEPLDNPDAVEAALHSMTHPSVVHNRTEKKNRGAHPDVVTRRLSPRCCHPEVAHPSRCCDVDACRILSLAPSPRLPRAADTASAWPSSTYVSLPLDLHPRWLLTAPHTDSCTREPSCARESPYSPPVPPSLEFPSFCPEAPVLCIELILSLVPPGGASFPAGGASDAADASETRVVSACSL